MVFEEGSHQEGVRATSVFLLSWKVNALYVLEVAREGAEVPDFIPGMLEAQ